MGCGWAQRLTQPTSLASAKSDAQVIGSRARAAGRFLATIALTYLGLLAVTFFIGRVIPVDPVLAGFRSAGILTPVLARLAERAR